MTLIGWLDRAQLEHQIKMGDHLGFELFPHITARLLWYNHLYENLVQQLQDCRKVWSAANRGHFT